MSLPRGIEERRDWFLSHKPAATGMCAQHTWHSLGGDQGNPPAWGCSDANQVYDKVKNAGRYWTSTPIPKGAAIYWKYGSNGHAALSDGDGKIVTTDPGNGKPTGVEDLDYPHRWGASSGARIWTDQYNGVRFDIGDEDDVDVLDYDYLGTPSGTFTITREYETLDGSSWSAPRTGWESTAVYLNVEPTFVAGKTHGAIRVRVKREDGSTHGHDTLPVDIDDLDDEGKVLLRYQCWEKGGKGESTKVQLACVGGLQSALVSTRWTAKAVVVG